jgi:hypothetical protein
MSLINQVIETETLFESPNKSLKEIRKQNFSLVNISNYIKHLESTLLKEYLNDYNIKTKCSDKEFVLIKGSFGLPEFLSYKYKKDQLKAIVRVFKLKLTGTNNELNGRIYSHLKLSSIIVKIQKVFRGHLQRELQSLRGPACMYRKLCNNDSDFFTGENITKIDYNQFISYRSDDGFIYGFDIISLYNLKLNTKSGENVLNPYNRSVVPSLVFNNLNKLCKLYKRIYNRIIDIQVEKEPSTTLCLEDRVREVFNVMDSFGHYTCPSWFMTLERNNVIRLIRELADIWYYRAYLTHEVQREICPRDPFRSLGILLTILSQDEDISSTRTAAIGILETMVNTGINETSRSLGVIFVLQSLTLVNINARESMPWLYEAVAYSNSGPPLIPPQLNNA